MAKVELSPRALADLKLLAKFIEGEAGRERADGYLARLRRRLAILGTFPEGGSARGRLRILSFERRVAIHYRPHRDGVLVLRILYAGRQP